MVQQCCVKCNVMERAVDLPGAAHLVLACGVVHLDPEQAVFEAMLTGWATQQRARFLKADGTIKPRLDLVRRFADYTNQYPWQWEPAEAEAVHRLAVDRAVDSAQLPELLADVLRVRHRSAVRLAGQVPRVVRRGPAADPARGEHNQPISPTTKVIPAVGRWPTTRCRHCSTRPTPGWK